MKFKWTYILKWYFIFFVLVEVFGEIVKNMAGLESVLSLLKNPYFYAAFVFTFTSIFLYTLVTYATLFRFHKNKTLLTIIGIIVLSWFPIIGIRFLLEETLMQQLFGVGNYGDNFNVGTYIKDNIYFGVLHSVLGAILFFIQLSKHNMKQALEVRYEKQQMELAFLRTQTSPHFLFNMLNNIYSLVFNKSEKALSAIDRLSQLLRYSLYESKSKFTIEKELEQLENYIQLESLRHTDDYTVELIQEIDNPDIKIPQFLFISFVENAIKHGLVTDKKRPITIKINANNHRLNYKVENVIAQKQKDALGGIGLKNLQKRLEILYNGDMHFNTQRVGDIFTAELEIPLK